jgi:hypothetical protein
MSVNLSFLRRQRLFAFNDNLDTCEMAPFCADRSRNNLVFRTDLAVLCRQLTVHWMTRPARRVYTSQNWQRPPSVAGEIVQLSESLEWEAVGHFV